MVGCVWCCVVGCVAMFHINLCVTLIVAYHLLHVEWGVADSCWCWFTLLMLDCCFILVGIEVVV